MVGQLSGGTAVLLKNLAPQGVCLRRRPGGPLDVRIRDAVRHTFLRLPRRAQNFQDSESPPTRQRLFHLERGTLQCMHRLDRLRLALHGRVDLFLYDRRRLTRCPRVLEQQAVTP